MATLNNVTTHPFGNLVLSEFTWDDFNIYKDSIIDYCLQNEKPNTVESNISPHAKHNLWESKFNFLESNDDSIIALKMWIISSCQDYVNHINKKNYRFIITDSWAHVTRENGYHLPHYHNNSTWSGIIYISCSENSLGKNYWTVPFNIERKPGLEFINDNFYVTPTPGKLILFPSIISHYAEPYTGKEPRIVIAFNSVCV